jgi:beta-N-acetylhexosaminidase
MSSSLSIEQKIGQLFFIGIAGPAVDDQTRELLDEINPGGVCLFARNIREARQTRGLLDALREQSGSTPFLSLDQEGGLVDRLRRIITPMPAANLFKDAQTVARFAAIVAEVVRILGFNMDFAPVVDVITKERESVSNGMFSRAFGENAGQATEFAAAFLESLQTGGVLGCVKHFPGLGAATVDSHEELPQVPITRDELHAVDLVPYQRLFERNLVHSVMVAHAAYPNTGLQTSASDGKLLPSSLSPKIVDGLLRTDLNFQGLVITDDLEMGAIVKNFGVGEACVLALEAGADMLAICADAGRVREGYQAVINAVQTGRISHDRIDRSMDRIESARSLLHEPLPFDTQRLAELSDAVARLNEQLRTETRP